MREEVNGPFIFHFAGAGNTSCVGGIANHSLLLDFPLHLAIFPGMVFRETVLEKLVEFLLLCGVGNSVFVSGSERFRKLCSKLARDGPELDDAVDVTGMLRGVQDDDLAQIRKTD